MSGLGILQRYGSSRLYGGLSSCRRRLPGCSGCVPQGHVSSGHLDRVPGADPWRSLRRRARSPALTRDSTRENYPPRVPCWVDTNQPDAVAVAEFHSGLYGWETEDGMPPDSGQNYFMGRLGGRDVGAVSGPFKTTYLSVANADDAAGRVRDAGGQVITESFVVPGAGAHGRLLAPRRGLLLVAGGAEPRLRRGRRARRGQLQQPAHRRPGGAKAFYGAVFGWATIDVGSPTWTLPGYGDHLEQINPGRARASRRWAPRRGSSTWWRRCCRARARWSITFAVDDADAEQARRLGGSVLAEPQDAPWVRFAVLAARPARPSPPASSCRRRTR